jgi:hypothetical protein
MLLKFFMLPKVDVSVWIDDFTIRLTQTLIKFTFKNETSLVH